MPYWQVGLLNTRSDVRAYPGPRPKVTFRGGSGVPCHPWAVFVQEGRAPSGHLKEVVRSGLRKLSSLER